MQLNKNDQNDAEGLAQIMRTGWYRSVDVKSFEARRARAILGAQSQLVGMTTRLSNHIRGVLKTFGLQPGAVRGFPFGRRVDVLLADKLDLAPIVRPMLTPGGACESRSPYSTKLSAPSSSRAQPLVC
ncbi:transposase [Hyphomicrobium sp. 1Nfss2.1]